MSINNLNTYLNVRDAHLRVVSGNVYAQAMNIGGINVETAHGLQSVSDTGNVTSNTLQFSNATTGFVTTANAQIGRDLVVTGNATVSKELTVTSNAIVSSNLNVSDDLIVTNNILASNNLTVTGNLHVTTIRSDSNVVAEYTGPHDRPLRKYPEVALTSSAINSDYKGYTIQRSSDYTVTYGTVEKLFNNAEGSDVNSWVAGWNGTSGTYDAGTGEHSGTYHTPGSNNVEGTGAALFTGAPDGEWVSLQIPNGIRLDHVKIRARDHTDGVEQYPKDFEFWGSNNGTDWSLIKSFTNQSWPGQNNKGSYHVNSNILYNRIAMIITKIPINVQNGTHCVFGQLEYYGYEEGSGSLDTTLKTVYNVPATTGTQLEVYYDGQDYSADTDFDQANEVLDKSGNNLHGSQNGGVGFDSTYKAFTFDGSSSQNITSSALGFTGDQPHTFSFWIKDNEMNHINTYVMHIGRTTHAASQNSSIEFRSDRIRWASYANDIEYPLTGITSNTWYHITGSYVGGGATPENKSLYINGKRFNDTGYNIFSGWEATAGDPLSFQSDAFVTLGSSTAIGTTHFNGSIANFRLYSKALNADQVKELYDYQKDYFLGSKSQVTLYKGHLGVGVTEPSGQLELAGDERIQQYPPRSMTGYETLVEGHGVFCAYASTVRNSSWGAWEAFNGDTSDSSRWISLDTYTGAEDTYNGSARLYSSAPLGEYVVLKLPYPIKLSSARVYGKSGSPDSNNQRQGPERGQIWGSNDGVIWEHVINYDFGDYQQAQWNEINNINSTKYYSQYGFIVTKKLNNTYTAGGATQGDYVAVTEIQYFGTPGPTTLDKGSLSLGRSLDVPRVSRYDVDTETPRPEKIVLDYDTTVNSSPTDISGKGNHAVFRGNSEYSAADKAFKFDGQGASYIYGSNLSGLPTGNAIYSLVGWINVKPSLTDTATVIVYGSAWGVETIANLSVNTSYGINGGIGGDHIKSTNAVITPNTWHHVAAVKKTSTGVCTVDTIDLYVDGVLITDKTYVGISRTQNIGSTTYVGVGGGFTGAQSDACNGLVSNPKIYSVALEPSEIRKLYNLGRTGRSMVISDTAVGIGKAPEAQLDVRGNLRVGGTIQVPLIISHRWINADTSVTDTNYIPYNSVMYENPSGIHSGTIFTCPIKGIYECHFASMTSNNGTYSGNHEWYINGTYTSPRRRGYAFNALGSVHKMAASHYYIECNSGDTIGVVSAGNQTWYGNATYSHSHMSIRLITPT